MHPQYIVTSHFKDIASSRRPTVVLPPIIGNKENILNHMALYTADLRRLSQDDRPARITGCWPLIYAAARERFPLAIDLPEGLIIIGNRCDSS